MIPQHLRDLIEMENFGRSSLFLERQNVVAGDIRRISVGSLDRLVLALRVVPESNTTLFTLVHSYVEFATEFDLVVAPNLTGLSYSIVVQSDLCAAVSTAELGPLVATVPTQIVEACFEGPSGASANSGFFVGPPLIGPLDARWDFKVEEGEIIREVSASVISALERPDSQWIFDFDEIFSALLLPVEDASELALAMYELWDARKGLLVVTRDHILLFDDRGLLNPDPWLKALGEAGILFFETVMLGLIERARSSFHEGDAEPGYSVGLEALRELQHV